MHSKVLLLDAIHHLQDRRPDNSVLVGDLQEVLKRRGVTWELSTVQAYLRDLTNQGVLERLDRSVYRLIPMDDS